MGVIKPEANSIKLGKLENTTNKYTFILYINRVSMYFLCKINGSSAGFTLKDSILLKFHIYEL